jgi:DNA repair exonuclease SbcCD ATPase subunit
MKAKKSKDLAMKLIDDLLDDDQENQESPSSDSLILDLSTRVKAPEETSEKKEDSGIHLLDEDISFGDMTTPLNFGEETGLTKPKGPPQSKMEDDPTQKISSEKTSPASRSRNPFAPNEKTEVVNQETARAGSPAQSPEDKVRSSIGRFASSQAAHSPAGAALAQSENLRIAQTRILDLEQEIERIRQENEQLAAVGETLRKRSDEYAARLESASAKSERDKETHQQEKQLLTQNLEAKAKEVEELSLKIDELEMRLSTNIQKIRVRERELENRLELVKMESQALVRNKDEIILDLKRQLDQINLELDNYRNKGHDLNKQLNDKQDMLRRTVKALRIALSMLEGDEEIVKPLKKAK